MHAFSFATVYINLRQNRQCLWGYFPGRSFWPHFVCIWPLKLGHLTQFGTSSACFGCDCEHTEKRLWSARVPNGLKRRANNTFLWQCNNSVSCTETWAKVLHRSVQIRPLDLDLKREDSVLNHSRCFQMTDLIWSVCVNLFTHLIYKLYWIKVLQ